MEPVGQLCVLHTQLPKSNGYNVSDHFRQVPKMIQAGKGAARDIGDIRLTRLGCYYVANSD
jgi:hypothetical protein